jgi:Flp pilus assembly pilin Flp
MNRLLARLLREERGSASVTMAVGVFVAVVMLALVTTVHGLNDAQSRADALAAEAARAAETAINTRGATLAVDPVDAQTAARQYLAAAHATGAVTITSPTTVTVTVTVDRPALFSLPGPTYHATATKNAVLVVGRA